MQGSQVATWKSVSGAVVGVLVGSIALVNMGELVDGEGAILDGGTVGALIDGVNDTGIADELTGGGGGGSGHTSELVLVSL